VFFTTAMAIALAAGGMIATGFAAPAHAQDYSREWRTAAASVSDAIAKSDTDEAVKALIAHAAAAEGSERQALVAQVDAALDGVLGKVARLNESASTPDDFFSTGQFNLNFGNKLRDPAMQFRGLKLMVDSNKAAPESVPLLTFYVGSLARDLGDMATAREYLTRAYDLKHDEPILVRLIVETYFDQDQYVEGLAVFDTMVAVGGAAIPEDSYRRMLQVTLEQRLNDQIVKRSADLVRYHPTEDTWNSALRVVLESFDFTADESVDLFRLMRLTNSMREARTYIDYIEAADARRMANEVLPIIEEGIELGLLDAEDVFVKEAREVAEARAPEDRDAAEEDAASARAASDSISARAAADNYYAIGNFAGAEEFYKLALERSPEDTDRLNMRIGLSQARQGKAAEARSSFEAVRGKRANIAAMWKTYLDLQQGS
jgi:tetratricopeptide (TPR) repeat protein